MELNIENLVKHPLQLIKMETVEINAKKYKALEAKESVDIGTHINAEVIDEKEGYSNIQIELIPKSKSFSLMVVVRGKFKSEEPLEKDKFEIFLAAQGVKILWSYAREVVYDISGRVLGSPFMLPTLDVVKTLTQTMKKEKEKAYDEKDRIGAKG